MDARPVRLAAPRVETRAGTLSAGMVRVRLGFDPQKESDNRTNSTRRIVPGNVHNARMPTHTKISSTLFATATLPNDLAKATPPDLRPGDIHPCRSVMLCRLALFGSLLRVVPTRRNDVVAEDTGLPQLPPDTHSATGFRDHPGNRAITPATGQFPRPALRGGGRGRRSMSRYRIGHSRSVLVSTQNSSQFILRNHSDLAVDARSGTGGRP